jgi:hypothetical protein
MGVQLSVLLIAHNAGSASAWLFALSLLGGISLLAGVSALRRARVIGDTATSKIASAAQGYAELLGRAEHLDDHPTVSPYTGLPCVWFHYEIARKSANNKWTDVETRRSDRCFRLVDGSGSCVVDPEGADVVSTRRQTWIRDGYRYNEQLLLAQDQLYAIGEFVTCSGTSLELDANADTATMLAEWKQDRRQLMERFDVNRDGEIDLAEWETARAEARAQVSRNHQELRLRDGPHVMRSPKDGRPYLLSNLHPATLARRSSRMAWFHLVLLIAAGGAFGWLVMHS